MKAIQTHYKGYHFRSRLEARWAVFFDALGLDWQYEPEGFELPSGNLYLPDFLIKSVHGYEQWVEIKPKGQVTDLKFDEFKKLKLGILLSGDPLYVLHEIYLDKDPKGTAAFMCHGCGHIIDGKCWDVNPNTKEITWYCYSCDMNHGTGDTLLSIFDKTKTINHHKGDNSFIDDCARVMGAAKKARSARFEHGQKG